MYLLFLKLELSLIFGTSFPQVVFNSLQPASSAKIGTEPSKTLILTSQDPPTVNDITCCPDLEVSAFWRPFRVFALPYAPHSNGHYPLWGWCLSPCPVTALIRLHSFQAEPLLRFPNWSYCLLALPPHSLKCRQMDSSRIKILVLCLGLSIDFKFKSKSLEHNL